MELKEIHYDVDIDQEKPNDFEEELKSLRARMRIMEEQVSLLLERLSKLE